MRDLKQQIVEAAAVVRQRCRTVPRVGIILGTGLATFTEQIERQEVIGYEEIPHFPRSTAIGHSGRLVCGTVCDTPVVTMDGRFHLYEGYALQQITLPVRVMKALGIELLIVSNASGGLNPNLAEGDIVVLDDHINLMHASPFLGVTDEELGPRLPDISCPYDRALRDRALEIARLENFVAVPGVYVALRGPCYETRAEYRLLRRIGGDVVGMSTVPEVIVARLCALRVLGLSVVTNVCRPDALRATDGERVVRAAASAEHKMRKIVCGILSDLSRASGRAASASPRVAEAAGSS